MRSEKEIRKDIAKLNAELAEAKGEKTKVNDCFLIKTAFNIKLIKTTDVDHDSSCAKYRVEIFEFSSSHCSNSYTSMYGFELNNNFEKITLEKYEELVLYFKDKINAILKKSREEYEELVEKANF